jgi:putative DNA methylase
VRAWGRWVLAQARRDLARFYPTYADFEPLVEVAHAVERRPLTLVPLKEDGIPDLDALNAEFGESYLANKSNPRWVAKPTVAYLWARTVACKNCGHLIPLLKTRWLAKKDKKRVLLRMTPISETSKREVREENLENLGVLGSSKSILGVTFSIETDVPTQGRTSAERIAHDKQIGGGTMSRSGAHCPVCNQVTMTSEDIRLEGQSGRLGATLTAVVVDGQKGKQYRLPTAHEIKMAHAAEAELEAVYADIPFGLPDEKITEDAKRNTWCVQYGFERFINLFTPRQTLSIGSMILTIRNLEHEKSFKEYESDWQDAIVSYLAIGIDRLADYNSGVCHWHLREYIVNTFQRFALPVAWDFSEIPSISMSTGGFDGAIEWISLFIEHAIHANNETPTPLVLAQSSVQGFSKTYDLILTDPPYYNSIGYSVLMDFFYVWLKRTVFGRIKGTDLVFNELNAPKWNSEINDGELVDDASRFDWDNEKSKSAYENGMAQVFSNCHKVLENEGRFVIVFAHKHPDAWETLVSAIIKSGFVVNGSWPIQTEMGNRTRALTGAALSSSVWLVCRKRPESARAGWDNRVLEEMRANISERLRQFWDAGIRGPDFVWAATGPALEAYSQYPIVKKANQPGEILTVGEFLAHVRRMVVDFVVGRVLTTLTPLPKSEGFGEGPGVGQENVDVSSLDSITTYYLLHRNDFGLNDAPAGPCILYAVSCGLSDGDLADRYDLLARRGGKAAEEEDPEEDAETASASEGTGSVFRLKAWNLRKRPGMGFEPGEDQTLERLPLFPELPSPAGRGAGGEVIVPLIDQVHRLMHLWRAGDVVRVDDYLDRRALKRNQLFHQLLQALIELSTGEERSLLESISNHVGAGGRRAERLI